MAIEVSAAAVEEVHRLLKSQSKEEWGLRVGVKGGGCSGLSYTMNIEAEPREHDRVTQVDGIRVFVDPKSYLYLNGLLLDFTHELMGGGFKFVNPNATRTCSCGSSFSA